MHHQHIAEGIISVPQPSRSTLAIPMGSELLLEAVRAFLRRRLRREFSMEL